MRILITGGNGQLGRDLHGALVSHDVVALSHGEMDVSNAAAVDAAFGRHRPEAVVHAAALTDTTRCEREPDAADAVNAAGTEHVAAAAARHGAALFAISTNEVFDGTKGGPYVETDATGAVNAYGASKLEGERRALRANPAARILRTSWLYGDGGNNFVEKVLAAARAGRALSFVSDEVATPTSTLDLAEALRSMIEHNAPPGVYHLANEGEASRYAWAREILRRAGIEAPIAAITTNELRASGYDGPRKPPYSVLANTSARGIGVALRPWQDALAAYFERAAVRADG